MEITIFDRIVMLLTGLMAVYLFYSFYQEHQSRENKKVPDRYYMASFAVLFIAGVLMILFGFGSLKLPVIKVVATLIPFGIAIGLVREFYTKYYKAFLILMVIGFILIALTSFRIITSKVFYPVFHAIAGLTIFFLPILVSREGRTNAQFYWVGIGGALIGIGGIALASLSFGEPLLGIFNAKLVFTILTPILLLMTLAFTYGFMKKIKNT